MKYMMDSLVKSAREAIGSNVVDKFVKEADILIKLANRKRHDFASVLADLCMRIRKIP